MNFQTAIEHIFLFEGGLVDHPKDPGGITKFGISAKAYPELGVDGVRCISKEEAAHLYKRDYWDVLRCDDMPDGLRLMVFDCAVNQGAAYAAKALQAALAVQTDGVIGPRTLEAARTAHIPRAAHRIAMNRFLRYARNPNWETFGEGWMSRLLSVSLLTLQ